ncbi:MAG: hypothetical protein ABS75_21300 [Pelagibacterium sp. SCN 63-23]|nr:MAG: hypothetical protein ABS75_21300 [Pelagibacterium sp. SCN 63-23]
MTRLHLASLAALMLLGTGPAFANTCLDAYTAEVEPIVSRKCVACHNDKSAGSGVSFQKGSGFDYLVDVESLELPSMSRVTPGDSQASYLAHKILGTHEDVGGSGSKMPPSGRLRAEEIDAIIGWIDNCPVAAP